MVRRDRRQLLHDNVGGAIDVDEQADDRRSVLERRRQQPIGSRRVEARATATVACQRSSRSLR
jgi:hypothetical protein